MIFYEGATSVALTLGMPSQTHGNIRIYFGWGQSLEFTLLDSPAQLSRLLGAPLIVIKKRLIEMSVVHLDVSGSGTTSCTMIQRATTFRWLLLHHPRAT